MYIERITLDGQTFRMFELVIAGSVMKVAEEKLDEYILEQIATEQYHKVRHIDEQYGYVVDQEIANTENEQEIRESIEDIMDDDAWINKYQNE